MIRSGREVSRIEGFSDAVFGFALTLLVVSLEVPDNFDGLKDILRGFIPFMATFAIVCWIWFEHYAFFRKFDAEDGLTIFLNCVLLFVVLFFVYPLKYVFATVIPGVMGTRAGARFPFTEDDARMMMWVYSGGFVAVMSIFVLLYWNQYRRRKVLALSPEQAFSARAGAFTHSLSVIVGIVSIVMSVTIPIDYLAFAGMIYALNGPLHWRNGVAIWKARERAFPSSTPAPR